MVEGSSITEAYINNSIVGLRSIVREGTRLDEMVMMGADFYEGEQVLSSLQHTEKSLPPLGIGRSCIIERAIIDKNARIGDEVVIRAKSDVRDIREAHYWIRDGITVIPRGAVIPSGTVL